MAASVFCPSCGREMEDNARFCIHCGKEVFSTSSSTDARKLRQKENSNGTNSYSTQAVEVCSKCRNPVGQVFHRHPSDTGPIYCEDCYQNLLRADISPSHLLSGECILWHRDFLKGILHRRIVNRDIVTNFRCLKYDLNEKTVSAQVPLLGCDVIVMNTHRVSESVGGGTFVGTRGVGVYGGPRHGVSKIVGDLLFVKD
jgi:DNA-directed RNA polymerase subunit RPC12/RpoP